MNSCHKGCRGHGQGSFRPRACCSAMSCRIRWKLFSRSVEISPSSRPLQGAARITHVPAVTELAQADQWPDFPEPVLQLLGCHMPQAKLPDTRKINQVTAAGQVKQFGRGGGVHTFTGTV